MDTEYKELKEQAYNELHSITPYVASLLRDDELVTTPVDSYKPFFTMIDCRYCIAGWAHDKTNDYSLKNNSKYCEKCSDLAFEMYHNWDGRKAHKRLLKSILKFTGHFKEKHK